MRKFKVCMLGAFAVGKTSLVRRFVHSIFDARYQTTLGVKIDKKSLDVAGEPVELLVWDLAGEDEFMKVRESYLRGTGGALLIADGTRRETLPIALELGERLRQAAGEVPMTLIVNKLDIDTQWTINRDELTRLRDSGWLVVETSAKTGEQVEQAFGSLAERMIAAPAMEAQS